MGLYLMCLKPLEGEIPRGVVVEPDITPLVNLTDTEAEALLKYSKTVTPIRVANNNVREERQYWMNELHEVVQKHTSAIKEKRLVETGFTPPPKYGVYDPLGVWEPASTREEKQRLAKEYVQMHGDKTGYISTDGTCIDEGVGGG